VISVSFSPLPINDETVSTAMQKQRQEQQEQGTTSDSDEVSSAPYSTTIVFIIACNAIVQIIFQVLS
jgi:hypothetical protein